MVTLRRFPGRCWWMLIVAPYVMQGVCLQAEDVQTALSDGIQTFTNGLIGTIITNAANAIVGL